MTTAATPVGGVHTVRRVITYLLLFVMVIIAAIGVGGLLHRLFSLGDVVLVHDVAGLAQSLAFTLIAGPCAAALWWFIWRRLAGGDRDSVAWGLYLGAMYTVALITAAVGILSMLAALIDGRWEPGSLAIGIAWAAVFAWHRWMLLHPRSAPTRLSGIGLTLGSLFGLIIAVGGALGAIGSVFDTSVHALLGTVTLGRPWWVAAVASLVWALGGALIWWWHWMRDDVMHMRTGFASVVLVAITGFGTVALAVVGSSTALYVLLRFALARTEPLPLLLAPFGTALAAALIGTALWSYLHGITRARGGAIAYATRLVTSGVALATAATGVGILVNSILAALGSPLIDSGDRSLLLAGISALAVGGPLWWIAWRPRTATAPDAAGRPGRRAYLVVIFGASALVALITLLVIGFRLFEFTLDSVTGESLLERVRAPLGLLVATGMVATYHFAVWRGDRASAPAAPERTVARVLLVAGPDAADLATAIREATGANVSVLQRAEPVTDGPDGDRVVAALDGAPGERLLVITGDAARVEVIQLEG